MSKAIFGRAVENVKTLSNTQQAHHVVAASPATVEHSRFPEAVKLFVHNFVSETNSQELHGFQCGNCSASNTANTEKKYLNCVSQVYGEKMPKILCSNC